MTTPDLSSPTHPDAPLAGARVAFVGKLGGVTRREAAKIVREQGGTAVDVESGQADLVVVGAEELPLAEQDRLLNDAIRDAAEQGRLEIVSETQFWERLGCVEPDSDFHRLYTPAMLADLLQVPVSAVRRWHRRGLIVPARMVHRLPYFDFQEAATARRLAQLLAAGSSPAAIEKKLAALARYVPDVERPLAQLSVIVEGKQILLRQEEGLVEPTGQMRIDFDALDAEDEDSSHQTPAASTSAARGDIFSLEQWRAEHSLPEAPEELVALAAELEDEGQLEAAAEVYRAVLAGVGPNAEVTFQLAELLYRLGDVTAARERYYEVIEIDEDYVEARANLGCVLAETGQPELAVAAFEGALRYHEDYADVHYQLARTLDDLDRGADAEAHWMLFLELAPGSPWAAEAKARLAAAP